MGAFLQALALSGWTIGRNVRIDIRWAGFDPERMRQYAQNWLRSRLMSFSLMPMQLLERCCAAYVGCWHVATFRCGANV
jgi:hypothetical protein